MITHPLFDVLDRTRPWMSFSTMELNLFFFFTSTKHRLTHGTKIKMHAVHADIYTHTHIYDSKRLHENTLTTACAAHCFPSSSSFRCWFQPTQFVP